VLFSPHPEMGDLIRKYIALDGYVRHYLPIRGFATMRDTLRHYRIADSPSFRLVQNAIDALMSSSERSEVATGAAESATAYVGDGDADIVALCRDQVKALPLFPVGDEGDLLRDVAARVAARIDPAMQQLAPMLQQANHLQALLPSWRHLASTMAQHLAAAGRSASPRLPAQALMELELSVALVECWTRAARFELALAGRA
jgi:hypothetical protein